MVTCKLLSFTAAKCCNSFVSGIKSKITLTDGSYDRNVPSIRFKVFHMWSHQDAMGKPSSVYELIKFDQSLLYVREEHLRSMRLKRALLSSLQMRPKIGIYGKPSFLPPLQNEKQCFPDVGTEQKLGCVTVSKQRCHTAPANHRLATFWEGTVLKC